MLGARTSKNPGLLGSDSIVQGHTSKLQMKAGNRCICFTTGSFLFFFNSGEQLSRRRYRIQQIFIEWMTMKRWPLPWSYEFWGQNFCLRRRHRLGQVPFLGHLQSSLVVLLQLIEKLMREANQWLRN